MMRALIKFKDGNSQIIGMNIPVDRENVLFLPYEIAAVNPFQNTEAILYLNEDHNYGEGTLFYSEEDDYGELQSN